MITAIDGLRFVAFQASFATTPDQYQATLLLIPAILRVTNTKPMEDHEAILFKHALLDELNKRPFEPVGLSDGRAG